MFNSTYKKYRNHAFLYWTCFFGLYPAAATIRGIDILDAKNTAVVFGLRSVSFAIMACLLIYAIGNSVRALVYLVHKTNFEIKAFVSADEYLSKKKTE